MKYISLDLEFTSLEVEEAKILEFGAIIEDTELKLPFDKIPKFHCYINHKTLNGSVYALAMNSEILKILAKIEDIKDSIEKDKYIKDNNILNDYEITEKFLDFLYENNVTDFNLTSAPYIKMKDNKVYPMLCSKLPKTKLILSGKNLQSKDIPLLKKLPRWNEAFILSHRTIDPAGYFIDWKNDKDVPNLETCKKRANIQGNVAHRAIDDAWDIILLNRTQY